jgi:citrate synthase
VRQLLDKLAAASATSCLSWLSAHREALEAAVGGLPLALSGVAAATLVDLGFSPAQGEMLYLLLRLPGAAAHALEQEGHGFRNFPFYPVQLLDDPAAPPAVGDGA